tara:strand:- start:120 stop:338 length:219 start_codon:yes stop_codon:yes gene_type:complete
MRITKKEQVKRWLNSGNTITSMDAFTMFKVTRLAGIVHDLKKDGMTIQNLQSQKNTNYAIYKVVKDGEIPFV